MNLRSVVVVVGVVGVVMAIVASVGPWWIVNFNVTVLGSTTTSNAEFRPLGYTVSGQGPLGSFTNTSDYRNDPNMGAVFNIGIAMTGLSIALGALMIMVTAASGSRAGPRKAGAALGVLAFVFGLIAPLYVMSQLPDSANRDGVGGGQSISGFWGTDSTSILGVTVTITWTAGWAWYVAIVSAVVFLIAGVAALMGRAPASPAPASVVPE